MNSAVCVARCMRDGWVLCPSSSKNQEARSHPPLPPQALLPLLPSSPSPSVSPPCPQFQGRKSETTEPCKSHPQPQLSFFFSLCAPSPPQQLACSVLLLLFLFLPSSSKILQVKAMQTTADAASWTIHSRPPRLGFPGRGIVCKIEQRKVVQGLGVGRTDPSVVFR